MRLLFITSTRLGDAVLSTGLLDRLLRDHPGALVTVAAGRLPAPLFAACPQVAELIVLEKRPLHLHWVALWRRVVGTWWDLVVDLRNSAVSYGLLCDRRVRLGMPDPALHRVAAMAARLGFEPPPAPRLWLTRAARARALALAPEDGPPLLACAPAANWAGKTWAPERFAASLMSLTQVNGPLAGARLAILGAEGERALCQPVLEVLPEGRRLDLVGALDPVEAAALLARARLFIGNDSGLMHVAAAMGTPTLGLFGPSRPEHYRPWGPHTAIVRTRRTVEEFMAEPGYDHRTTGSLMGEIEVEQVLAEARALLGRTGPTPILVTHATEPAP